MDQITGKIYIGNYLDGADTEAIQKAGIRSILSLDGSLAGCDFSEHEVEKIEVSELIDGRGNSRSTFVDAVKRLRKLVTRHAPVLVQCHAGRSRSPAVVACHFMWHEGMTLGEAMGRISERREVIITAGLQEVFDFKP